MNEALGRRERKKRETMNAIEVTAVRLALANGFANVSVAEICEEVDISRSTFFNYVGSLEDAVLGQPLRMIPLDEAMAILDADSGQSLLRRLYVIAEASVGSSRVHAEVSGGRYRLALEQPDLLARVLSRFTGLSNDLLALMYVWLETDPSRRTLDHAPTLREASLTVALVGNALQTLLLEASGSDDAEIPAESFEDLIEQQETLARELVQPR